MMSKEIMSNLENLYSDNLSTASQWQLMTRKFTKHRLAVWSGSLIIALYTCALFCEFISPYSLDEQNIDYIYAPPQRLHWIGSDGIYFTPFVYGLKGIRHPTTLRKIYVEDTTKIFPLQF